MKTSLGQLSLYVPNTFELIFLKICNLSHLIHLENNTKTSCYLVNIPVDFRFICLSLFRYIVVSAPFFTHTFYLWCCPLYHPVHRHACYPLCFFLLLFCLLILSDVDSMHFVTFLFSHVKCLLLKSDLC